MESTSTDLPVIEATADVPSTTYDSSASPSSIVNDSSTSTENEVKLSPSSLSAIDHVQNSLPNQVPASDKELPGSTNKELSSSTKSLKYNAKKLLSNPASTNCC